MAMSLIALATQSACLHSAIFVRARAGRKAILRFKKKRKKRTHKYTNAHTFTHYRTQIQRELGTKREQREHENET